MPTRSKICQSVLVLSWLITNSIPLSRKSKNDYPVESLWFLNIPIGEMVIYLLILFLLLTLIPNHLHGECSICMSEMHTRQDLETLPCQHTFHEICIDEWYYVKVKEGYPRNRLSCPLCRQVCQAECVMVNYVPIIIKNALSSGW